MTNMSKVGPAPQVEPAAAKERMDAKCADMLACIRNGIWKEADYVKVSTALLRAILEDREAEPAPAEPDFTAEAESIALQSWSISGALKLCERIYQMGVEAGRTGQ